MAESQKQVYRYNSKVAGLATYGSAIDAQNVVTISDFTSGGAMIAPYRIGLELVNPIDLLTVEGLVTHFRATNMAAGAKVIGIGVYPNEVDIYGNLDEGKRFDLNISQVGGVIDFTKDLSSIINKTGRNIVVIFFDRYTAMSAKIWKNEMLYTVTGVK
jgi:hypothetical protein